MARYGHRDWIVWADADGSHAAVKTIKNVKSMVAAHPSSWSLISADDGVPMKGFDWLATNLIANMQMGF